MNNMKKKKQDGFTLAELLIVVAIIAVLVAVSIPIFTAQLEKARLATNQANARAAYASAVVADLELENAEAKGYYIYDVATGQLVKDDTTGDTKYNGWSWNSSPITNLTLTKPISDWKTDDKSGDRGILLGKKVATQWYVYVGNAGKVNGYMAKMP